MFDPSYVGHVDDADSSRRVLETLQAIHGPDYAFSLQSFSGLTTLTARPDRTVYWFILRAERASIALRPGDRVRGAPPEGPFRSQNDAWAEATDSVSVPLWPGDVVAAGPGLGQQVAVLGRGLAFVVATEATDYTPPKAAFLRHLPDKPGGCASHPGAFRREALPPQRPDPAGSDRRGANRVNEHTLDMRVDRPPGPSAHHHAPVPVGPNRVVNHSETAIVLPRSVYGLPEVDRPDEGQIVLYTDPLNDPAETVTVPVRPGSMVVTPATSERVWGHRFENCFAMLVAIPGFVSPSRQIESRMV